VLCAALLLVLLLDPWAVLAPGFWLSFGAVAVILYVATGRLRAGHGLALGESLVQWGRVQWAITLALAPLLLVWFQQMSLVSPLANAVAIPLVSLVVTPLALAGSVLPFDFILKLAHAVMAGQMWLLEWCAALPAAVWQQHAPAAWTVALALAGTAWLLLPRGVPARWLGLPLLLPMFTAGPPAPTQGALWLTVLDVGQGLAVFVQTERHALLYDAGPAYSPEADSGSRAILPFLRASGIAQLDALVVSHDDNDHAGGAASVLAGLPVAALYSSLPEAHAAWLAASGYRLPCAAGQGWDWDGVRFELLHPAAGSYAVDRIKSNDRSCVLKIAAARGAVLLTGDIEARSELEMLERGPGELRADVLVAPHHSSRTSSTPEFIAAVQPRWAVLPVGYRNRFGHPKEEVVERYRASGAQMLRTDNAGAVLVRIDGSGIDLRAYRRIKRRYWYAD
jgi:competence protein ComEC